MPRGRGVSRSQLRCRPHAESVTRTFYLSTALLAESKPRLEEDGGPGEFPATKAALARADWQVEEHTINVEPEQLSWEFWGVNP